jgi:hypothetical protein
MGYCKTRSHIACDPELLIQIQAGSGMKSARKLTLIVALVVCARLISAAQPQAPAPKPAPAATPSLDAIMLEIQQASQAANLDLGRLRIDRWKTDANQKTQFQQIADSLRKNLTYAVPDLLAEVRSSRGSVSSTFKLYHNLNVVYEYLNTLVDAAGGMGKGEEYDPLNKDAADLDTARQHLSAYIEQAATSLENKAKAAAVPPAAATPQPTPKKIIVDDNSTPKPVNTKKKKTSTPQPASTPQ